MKIDLLKNAAHINAISLTICIMIMCTIPGGTIYTLGFCALQLICTVLAYKKYLSQKVEISKSHSAFGRKINKLKNECRNHVRHVKLKNLALKRFNELGSFLLSENRVTKPELRKFIVTKEEGRQYFIDKNDPAFK